MTFQCLFHHHWHSCVFAIIIVFPAFLTPSYSFLHLCRNLCHSCNFLSTPWWFPWFCRHHWYFWILAIIVIILLLCYYHSHSSVSDVISVILVCLLYSSSFVHHCRDSHSCTFAVIIVILVSLLSSLSLLHLLHRHWLSCIFDIIIFESKLWIKKRRGIFYHRSYVWHCETSLLVVYWFSIFSSRRIPHTNFWDRKLAPVVAILGLIWNL